MDRIRNHPPPPPHHLNPAAHRPYNANHDHSEREWLSSDVDSIRRASYDFLPQQQRNTRGDMVPPSSHTRRVPPNYGHATSYSGSKTLPHQRPANVKWVVDRPNDNVLETNPSPPSPPLSSASSDIYGSGNDYVNSNETRTGVYTDDSRLVKHTQLHQGADYSDYSDSGSNRGDYRVDNIYSTNNKEKSPRGSYYHHQNTDSQHHQQRHQQEKNLLLLQTTPDIDFSSSGRQSPQSDIALTTAITTEKRRTIYDDDRCDANSDVGGVSEIRRCQYHLITDDLYRNKSNSWRQPDRPSFLDLSTTPNLSSSTNAGDYHHHPKSLSERLPCSTDTVTTTYARSEGSPTPLTTTGNTPRSNLMGNAEKSQFGISQKDNISPRSSAETPISSSTGPSFVSTNNHVPNTIYDNNDTSRAGNVVKTNNIAMESSSRGNARDVHNSQQKSHHLLESDRNTTTSPAIKTFPTGTFQPTLGTTAALPLSRDENNCETKVGTPKTIYDTVTTATTHTTQTTKQETGSVSTGSISASEMIRRLNSQNNIQQDQRDRSSSAGSSKSDGIPQQPQQLQQNHVMNAPKRFEAKTIQRASSKAKDIAAKFNKTLTIQPQQNQQQNSTAKTTENTLQRLNKEGKISARCPKCKWRKVDAEGIYCTECRAEYLVCLKQRVACGDSQDESTHASSSQQPQENNVLIHQFKCVQCGWRLVETVDDYCDHCESEYL